MSARRSGTVAMAMALCACGAPPPPASTAEAPPPVPTTVEGPIVARVDGAPIGLAEVEATARDTGLTPLEALHRLEQERVLLARAHAAGIDAQAEADDTTRRAAVQALLAERVERAADESSVTDEEIAARYASTRASWARPERRASTHVLVTAPEGDEAAQAAARRFVEHALARMAAAADPSAEADAIGAEASEGRSFTVRVEHVPAVERHGAVAEPYLAALFAIPRAPGVAPAPVTTTFGLHAIALTGIEPPFEASLEEARPILRRQLVAEHRAAALDALTAELAARAHVAIDERVLADVARADLSAVEATTP